jgi:hypothetical protein
MKKTKTDDARILGLEMARQVDRGDFKRESAVSVRLQAFA